jgi:chemotaxis protein methyltransferase CheR
MVGILIHSLRARGYNVMMKPALGSAVNPSREDEGGKEFLMTKKDFQRIQKIAYTITGINLGDHKQSMVYGRLARRLRALQLKNFEDYCLLVEQENSGEIDEFVNSITTNLTSFFRENHHFEYLRNTVLPELLVKNAQSRRLRIWSAGCSTGEEPYSIAMVLRTCTQLAGWDVKVLATDLDSNVIANASRGEYAVNRADTIPDEFRRFFVRSTQGDLVRIKDDVRNLITFKQLNLLNPWPMKGPFDLIFCRNVVIYFDLPTQITLFDRYAEILRNQGYLFIGHSENLHKVSTRFANLGKTMYRRLS